MSIKLKKKYDYIKTQDGKIIPISSIISIEIYNPLVIQIAYTIHIRFITINKFCINNQILIMVYQIIILILN